MQRSTAWGPAPRGPSRSSAWRRKGGHQNTALPTASPALAGSSKPNGERCHKGSPCGQSRVPPFPFCPISCAEPWRDPGICSSVGTGPSGGVCHAEEPVSLPGRGSWQLPCSCFCLGVPASPPVQEPRPPGPAPAPCLLLFPPGPDLTERQAPAFLFKTPKWASGVGVVWGWGPGSWGEGLGERRCGCQPPLSPHLTYTSEPCSPPLRCSSDAFYKVPFLF